MKILLSLQSIVCNRKRASVVVAAVVTIFVIVIVAEAAAVYCCASFIFVKTVKVKLFPIQVEHKMGLQPREGTSRQKKTKLVVERERERNREKLRVSNVW